MGVTINAEEAAAMLRKVGISITAKTIRAGLRQRVFPFGDYIEAESKDEKPTVKIYTKLLRKFIEERT
jgi:hypothetical protein